jgi:hypothetical protein
MDRFENPAREREARSAKDSLAAYRIKLYKERRRLSDDADASTETAARGETDSAGRPRASSGTTAF